MRIVHSKKKCLTQKKINNYLRFMETKSGKTDEPTTRGNQRIELKNTAVCHKTFLCSIWQLKNKKTITWTQVGEILLIVISKSVKKLANSALPFI